MRRKYKNSLSIIDILQMKNLDTSTDIYPLILDDCISELRACKNEKKFWKKHDINKYESDNKVYTRYFVIYDLLVGILFFEDNPIMLYEYLSDKFLDRYILDVDWYEDMMFYFNYEIGDDYLKIKTDNVCMTEKESSFITKYPPDTDLLTLNEFKTLSEYWNKNLQIQEEREEELNKIRDTCKMLDINPSHVLSYRSKYDCSLEHAIIMTMR